MSQNRLLAILLGVVATLVLVVGGLSAVLLLSGDDEAGGGGGGISGGGSSASAVDDDDITNRLRLASGDPVTMDPHLAGDSLSAEYIVEIFGGLLTITPQLGLGLDLAESWAVSKDGLTYTFVLRPDITFHTGRRVTADDVLWSIERATSPVPEGATRPSTTAMAYLGDIEGVAERFFSRSQSAPPVSGLTVVDADRLFDHT